jgi:uncharacterized repeat protein (TIGR01451 family)
MIPRKAISTVSGSQPACDLFHTVAKGVKRILASLSSEGKSQMIFKMLGAAAVLTIALPAAAQAPAKSGVQTRLDVHKVVRAADGRESIVLADSAKPGDILVYDVTYTNAANEAVRDFVATLPIPQATEYIPGSAKPAAVKASLDARTFSALPLKRKVQRNGREVEEAVPLGEYRYLQWTAPELGANKSLTFVARVKVVE